MKLLLALMIWSQGCFASAAASASAAVDEKTVGEKERKSTYVTPDMRSAEVSKATEMAPEVSDIIAEYAAEYAPEHPRVPESVRADLWKLRTGEIDSFPKSAIAWIMEAPNNISGIISFGDMRFQLSLLSYLIRIYADSPKAAELQAAALVRGVLDLKPDVRFKNKSFDPAFSWHNDALGEILWGVSREKTHHLEFIKKIIDLSLEQGATLQEIEEKLQLAYDDMSDLVLKAKGDLIAGAQYSHKMIAAALEYLHDIQAAAVLEEELTGRLGGVRPLGRIGGEYIAPLKKKGGKAPSAGKSGSGK